MCGVDGEGGLGELNGGCGGSRGGSSEERVGAALLTQRARNDSKLHYTHINTYINNCF